MLITDNWLHQKGTIKFTLILNTSRIGYVRIIEARDDKIKYEYSKFETAQRSLHFYFVRCNNVNTTETFPVYVYNSCLVLCIKTLLAALYFTSSALIYAQKHSHNTFVTVELYDIVM